MQHTHFRDRMEFVTESNYVSLHVMSMPRTQLGYFSSTSNPHVHMCLQVELSMCLFVPCDPGLSVVHRTISLCLNMLQQVHTLPLE